MITWDGEEAHLDDYTYDEWWEVCRALRPELSREEFDRMWDDFCAMKLKRTLH